MSLLQIIKDVRTDKRFRFYFKTPESEKLYCVTEENLEDARSQAKEMADLHRGSEVNLSDIEFIRKERFLNESYNMIRRDVCWFIAFLMNVLLVQITCWIYGNAYYNLLHWIYISVVALFGMQLTLKGQMRFIIKALNWHTIYDTEFSTCELDAHDYQEDKGGDGIPCHFYEYTCTNCKAKFKI